MRTQHNYRISCGKPTKIAKDNRWKAWLSWTDYETGSRKKKAVYWRERPTKPDKEAAEDKLLKELKEHEADPSLVATRVKQYQERQRKELERGNIKESTWEAKDYDLKRLLKLLNEPSDGLGPYTWQDFPKRVQVFEDDLADWTFRGQRISPDRHRHTYFLMKYIVQLAQQEELVFTQPLNNNPAKRDTSTEQPLHHTREDFKKKLMPLVKGEVEGCKGDLQIQTIVRLCAESGLRYGEARGLKWEDIELPANLTEEEREKLDPELRGKVLDAWVHVQRSAPGNATTKTRTGNRYVPLSYETVVCLHVLRTSSTPRPADDDYIFVDAVGEPESRNILRRKLQAYLEKAGLPTKQPYQTLRRSYATWNVINGTQPPMLMSWMGHADFQTTYKFYAAFDKKMKPQGAWTEPNLG